MLFRAMIAACAAVLAVPGAAFAETGAPAATPEVDPAYYAVYDAISGGIDRNVVAENMLDVLLAQLTTQPGMLKLMKADPQLGPDLKEALRPVLLAYGRESDGVMRASIGPRLAARMTTTQAREIVAFFNSPVGQRMMQTVSRNYDGSASLSGAIENPDAPVTGDQVMQDATTAVRGTLADLSKEDYAEIDAFARTPAGVAFNKARSEMFAVRVEVENRPIPQSYVDQIKAAVDGVLEKHFPRQ